jgi:hypothetical protein
MSETCGKHGTELHGPCYQCGAPECCRHCCYEASLEARIAGLERSLQQLHDIMRMGGFDCPELTNARKLLGGEG